MKTYKVTVYYKELTVEYYTVEAESEDEAKEIYKNCDPYHSDIVESERDSIEVEEVSEEDENLSDDDGI